MEITFSRHARRRMRLYKVDEYDVTETVNTYEANNLLTTGRYEVINKQLIEKYGYPLKVVYQKENTGIVVITAYPVRKGRRL
ncbi:MAG: DUF4258 domain-containing protein [Candidatus Brocadiaceae bacterium]